MGAGGRAVGGNHRRLLWGSDTLSRGPTSKLGGDNGARGRGGGGGILGRGNGTGEGPVARGNVASLRISKKAHAAGIRTAGGVCHQQGRRGRQGLEAERWRGSETAERRTRFVRVG